MEYTVFTSDEGEGIIRQGFGWKGSEINGHGIGLLEDGLDSLSSLKFIELMSFQEGLEEFKVAVNFFVR